MSISAPSKALLLFAAALAIAGSAVVVLGEESSATYEEDYGTVYEIKLAPGFRYSYTPTYPSDLTVTTSILKYESDGITASVSDGTLFVTVVDGTEAGTSYDVILQAVSETGGLEQTAYQHIRFVITTGLQVSAEAPDIVIGESVSITPTASSGMTDPITWTAKTMPSGLSMAADGTVTGTPASVGTQTIVLTAAAEGQTEDLTIEFTVYSRIVGASDQTITSYGDTVSTAAVVQTGSDLNVVWSITDGALPSGFELDSSTGVISGSSTETQSSTVTVTGTDEASGQRTSFVVTIASGSLADTGADAVTASTGTPRTSPYEATVDGVSWSVDTTSVPEGASVSIDPSTGILTVSGTSATAEFTVYVIATTDSGASSQLAVTCQVVSELSYTSAPTTGVRAYVIG